MRNLLSAILVLAASVVAAQEATPDVPPEPPMTYERLGRIIFALDPQAQPRGDMFEMRVAEQIVVVVTDRQADRMRVMVPIREAHDLTEPDLRRMMQANFDSALDARYAVANGILWAAYIHPLSPLEKDQFISGLVQTVTAAQTYGTFYTGGSVQFGSGDSNDLQEKLLEELLKRGEKI